MHVVRIEHSVPSYEKWKQVFDSDPADRKGSGVRRYQVHRLQADPSLVFIDLEFGTLGEAEAFVRKMEGIWAGPAKAIMQNPRARIVERVVDESL